MARLRLSDPGPARSAEDLLSLARRRGAQLRRRRHWLLTGGATAAAGALAVALLVVLAGPSPQSLRVVGSPPGAQGCPASAFSFWPLSPPQGGLEAGPGLAHGAYAHLAVGQSVVLYQGPGQSITLSRGVASEAFSVSAYAHGPKPLDEIQVLDGATYYYPPGAGLPDGRIPFRFPAGAAGASDPCDRYQLVGKGVIEPSLMATAERFHALVPGPATPTSSLNPPSSQPVVTVPAVLGLRASQAVATLAQAGLQLQSLTQPNPGVPGDTVFQERPRAGSRVPEGATVTIVVSGVPLQDVDWAAVSYPVSCGGTPAATKLMPLTPAPGLHLELVFVQCPHGAGSPPSAALVYDYASSSTSPHLEQTLFTYQDDWLPVPGGVSSNPPAVSIRVDGYTGRTPRCCPDIHATLTWTWAGATYQETSSEPTHSQLPSS
ncbi:MAG TPA: PASTA domain-containing protein [Acidimicrobiales bacterium]|nr:PASTA domain-containing protein [Acidimicrobiales bacterium]